MSSGPLSLPRPDDWHLHLRDGATLVSLMRDMPRTMARAIVMPNLRPPVTTAAAAVAYRERIIAALPAGSDFEPLMTLYLTDLTTPEEISRASAAGVVACKLYPAGATTNSDAGVTDVARVAPALERMAELRMLLLVHGEVTTGDVDIFDRERVFIERVLRPLVAQFPALRIVLEHITTAFAAEFVAASGPNIAATITAHHLLLNRNGAWEAAWRRFMGVCCVDTQRFALLSKGRVFGSVTPTPPPPALFEGGLRPHRYCLPILKAESDREALVAAVRSGSPKFFLGTDSAPHSARTKECACGAAGSFTAHAALELYATAFEAAGCLPALRGFACEHGPAFYGLPPNATRLPRSRVELRREVWRVPAELELGGEALVPLNAGQDLAWRAYVVEDSDA